MMISDGYAGGRCTPRTIKTTERGSTRFLCYWICCTYFKENTTISWSSGSERNGSSLLSALSRTQNTSEWTKKNKKATEDARRSPYPAILIRAACSALPPPPNVNSEQSVYTWIVYSREGEGEYCSAKQNIHIHPILSKHITRLIWSVAYNRNGRRQ